MQEIPLMLSYVIDPDSERARWAVVEGTLRCAYLVQGLV